MSRRSGVSIRTKIYNKFRGVDFASDPSLVDDSRSPWAPNIIADDGGMPEKRPGWRILRNFDDGINGLFAAVFGGERHLLVHTGTKLYRWYEEEPSEGHYVTTLLSSALPDRKSMAVYMNSKLWIFTGNGYFVYDGVSCSRVSDIAYIPLTVIGRAPSGGGQTYEDINLLTGKQKVGFQADGTSTVYTLPYQAIDAVNTVTVNGVTKTVTTDYTVDLINGTVAFVAAPPAPVASGEDNVFITFTKNISGYTDRIDKCTNAVVWGIGGAADRIICTGNPSYQNQDWISGYSDGTYFPDLGYATVGTEETAIMGYRRLGEYLAIIKEDNGQDSTVFIRTGTIDDDGEPSFSVKPCLSGAGGISRFGFGNINDEQLILTMNGVYALTTNSLTSEKIVQARSRRIDPKLVKEDLDTAICVNWNNCFLVFVNDQVYGLDGRQAKSYTGRNDTDFLYEAFYWTNIPATAVLHTIMGEAERRNSSATGSDGLFFGTAAGEICKFNTDIAGLSRYNDNNEPIVAIWSTKADDDGDAMILKTLQKKGNAVTIKPYNRSSAKILFRTDKDAVEWQAAYGTMDIFDWEDIDFSRFSFNANDGPSEVPFNRKVKKYKRLQIFIKNDVLNEGFGVFAITKHYVTGNFAKK